MFYVSNDKLVVIINSLKVPKIKKMLLYEMKFLVPNYSCLQNPWLGGYRPQIPVLSVLFPPLNVLNPSPARTKFLGTPLVITVATPLSRAIPVLPALPSWRVVRRSIPFNCRRFKSCGFRRVDWQPPTFQSNILQSSVYKIPAHSAPHPVPARATTA